MSVFCDCGCGHALCQVCIKLVCVKKTTWVHNRGNVCDACISGHINRLFQYAADVQKIYEDKIILNETNQEENKIIENFKCVIRELVKSSEFRRIIYIENLQTWEHCRIPIRISWVNDSGLQFLTLGEIK